MGKPPCCEKNGVKKGPWSTEEDNILIDYIRKHGHGRWRTLPKNAGLKRCGKSCRLRWTNYLRPDIKRGRFSLEEEQAIVQLHSVLGNKWSAIAAQLPGRTDNEIKNFWNTHIKKKLLRMGIDPVTHAPRLDLLDLHCLLTLYNHSQIQSLNITNIPSSSHQNILTSAPLYNMNVENHPSFDHFPDENQLHNTTSLPQLGNNNCGFPGFCQRADEYVQEINTPQQYCDGCNNKVKNYGIGSSLSSPLSGSSITLHSSSAMHIGSSNEDEIKGGYCDYSTANYDLRNGFYVNGLM